MLHTQPPAAFTSNEVYAFERASSAAWSPVPEGPWCSTLDVLDAVQLASLLAAQQAQINLDAGCHAAGCAATPAAVSPFTQYAELSLPAQDDIYLFTRPTLVEQLAAAGELELARSLLLSTATSCANHDSYQSTAENLDLIALCQQPPAGIATSGRASPSQGDAAQPDTSHLRRPLRSSSRRQVSRTNSRRLVNDPDSVADLARATSIISNSKVSLRDAMATAFGVGAPSKAGSQPASPKQASTAAAAAASPRARHGAPPPAASAGAAADPTRRARVPRHSATSSNLGASRPAPARSSTFTTQASSSSSSWSMQQQQQQLLSSHVGGPTPGPTTCATAYPTSSYSLEPALSYSPPQLPGSYGPPERAATFSSGGYGQQLMCSPLAAMPAASAAGLGCGTAASASAADAMGSSAAAGGWSSWRSTDFSSCVQQAAGI